MAGRFEVRLLGEVEVRSFEAAVPISGPKLKAIVALLALGSPQPVAAEWLIDQVWEEDLPSNPTNSLHAQLSILRRLLGRDAVERRGHGYLLTVGPDDVDAIRLERLVRAGREASIGGDPDAAFRRYSEALDLVRGPPLSDIGEFRFAREAAVRLGELISTAREGVVDGRLAAGDHAGVVAELTALVQAHPHHEHFRAQLITALYRCGRQADALQAYQQARTDLREELGVEPGSEMRALEIAILNQDPALDSPAIAPSAGPKRGEPSPALAPTIDAGRLPLVGRGEDVKTMRADLASARLGRGRIALVGGEPGVGKTRLAEEIASEAAELGAAVVWGRCYDGRGAPAFWPWVQIVTDLLDRFDNAAVTDALMDTAADLAQVLPVVKEFVPDFAVVPPLDPESAQFRLGQAMSRVIRRLARTRPLIVVLDDVHWADPASLDVLVMLADSLDDAPILAIATFRSVDPTLGGALADALAQLSRRPTTRRHDLSGLDVTALAVWPTAQALKSTTTSSRQFTGGPTATPSSSSSSCGTIHLFGTVRSMVTRPKRRSPTRSKGSSASASPVSRMRRSKRSAAPPHRARPSTSPCSLSAWTSTVRRSSNTSSQPCPRVSSLTTWGALAGTASLMD